MDVWGSLDRVSRFVAVVQLTMWRPMIEGMLLMTHLASEKAGIQRISSASRRPFAVIVAEDTESNRSVTTEIAEPVGGDVRIRQPLLLIFLRRAWH